MITTVSLEVLGLPQAKGSTRAFLPKGRQWPVVTSTNRNLKAWELQIRATAQAAANGVFFERGTVAVDVRFYLPRPKSAPKRVTTHCTKPDLDKLVRAVDDALTQVLWRDDSQVTEIYATKVFALVGEPARAVIRVTGDVHEALGGTA